jgi:hypothetical protein
MIYSSLSPPVGVRFLKNAAVGKIADGKWKALRETMAKGSCGHFNAHQSLSYLFLC